MFDLRRITSISDPCLLPALRIYEQAFPPHEQMTPSFWIGNLLDSSEHARHFVAAIDRGSEEVVGMAFYEIVRPADGAPIVRLWYLCTRAGLRGQGVGSQVYQKLISQFFAEGIGAMLFEVERPDTAIQQGVEAAELAARRIRWYQRNGARLLLNVDYLQPVDNGLPPTPMYLMIHSSDPAITPDEALRLATVELRLPAAAIGPLRLE
jgi:ribosomal protein S18 acetylase RimI-like enzyme